VAVKLSAFRGLSFTRLLTCSAEDLFAWFFGHEVYGKGAVAQIVIRTAARGFGWAGGGIDRCVRDGHIKIVMVERLIAKKQPAGGGPNVPRRRGLIAQVRGGCVQARTGVGSKLLTICTGAIRCLPKRSSDLSCPPISNSNLPPANPNGY